MMTKRDPTPLYGEVIRRSPCGRFICRTMGEHAEEFPVEPPAEGLHVGDWIKGTRSHSRRAPIQVQIDRVFAGTNVVDLANDVTLDMANVPQRWPVWQESTEVPAIVDAKIVAARTDLRDVPFVTIDGSNARDFDDAVFCEEADAGWRLVVAIADVAHYVRVGSVLDTEARLRGTSLYLPDRVIPMLPEALSNGICSLNPHEDRLVLACDMRLNTAGEVVKSSFYEAVIRSQARLTYREVADFLRNKAVLPAGVAARQSVLTFYEAYEALLKHAQQRGALDFHTRETFVKTNGGQPTHVFAIERNQAHQMIECAMVAANVQAAEYLERNGLMSLYRVHEKPNEHGTQAVCTLLQERGVDVPDSLQEPSQLQELLVQIRLHCKPAHIWEFLLLTAMEQAYYGPTNLGHFGLALDAYTHFTSPIRRYPDLIVHRLIKATFAKGDNAALSKDELEKLGNETSMCERRAVTVERKVSGWLKAHVLKRKVGNTFSGTIVGVKPFGAFVELDDYGITGLAHVSSLPRDYYINIGSRLVGERTNRTFELGDIVQVRLEDVQAPAARLSLRML